jgi:hypothetical protein
MNEARLAELNARVDVAMAVIDRLGPYGRAIGEWDTMQQDILTAAPPDFGVAAVNSSGDTVEVFGPSAPFKTDEQGNIVGVMGYEPPEPVAFETLGANSFADTLNETLIRSSRMETQLRKTSEAFKTATQYIVEEFCDAPVMPTEITLSLDADFNLVVGVSTGTEIKWVLADVCKQYLEG